MKSRRGIGIKAMNSVYLHSVQHYASVRFLFRRQKRSKKKSHSQFEICAYAMSPSRLIIFALLLCAFIVASESRPVTFPRRKNTDARVCPPGYRYARNVGCRKILSFRTVNCSITRNVRNCKIFFFKSVDNQLRIIFVSLQ